MLAAHEEIAKYMSRYGDAILVVAAHPIGKEHPKAKTCGCGGGDVAVIVQSIACVYV